MYAKTHGLCVNGIDGYLVTVEVDITPGLPSFDIVGLPATSVKEAKERVRSAIKNGGFQFPMKRIVVNLAPAHVRKDGSSLDLAIAMGILAAMDEEKKSSKSKKAVAWDHHVYIGELSLDGSLQPVIGMLSMVMGLCHAQGMTMSESAVVDTVPFLDIYVPEGNLREAESGSTLPVMGVRSLSDVVKHLQGEAISVMSSSENQGETCSDNTHQITQDVTDISEVKGQYMGKRALEIAAAGGHHLLMTGPPGSGKTMLAKCLPGLLPPLTKEEQLEVSRIYSVMGLLTSGRLMRIRPFRSPHHTSTLVAMVGGGQTPKPGEITLAHKGVLFLDEAPEFKRPVIEVLRQPLEERVVHISRVGMAITYPSDCIVVMAMNPCPCGWFGTAEDHRCTCTVTQIQRYQRTLSGPILDRMDLVVPVERPTLTEINAPQDESNSLEIRQKVVCARRIQEERFRSTGIELNSHMSHKDIESYANLSKDGKDLLETAFTTLHLSVRSYDRIIKVARTIADLESSTYIEANHIAEALSYRQSQEGV